VIKILVADDHPVVRLGLKQIIGPIPGMSVLGEARTGREALNLVDSQPWDIVLLDISMPDGEGLDVLKEIKRKHPRLPVLMLSFHAEAQYAV
jgi:two-component system invasion response regulator UvrY